MKKLLQKVLFKKDFEKLEADQKEVKLAFVELEKWRHKYIQEIIQKEKDFQREKNSLWDKYEKHLKENAEQELKKYTKKLRQIYDYKLFPGAKVWVYEWFGTVASRPTKVEIQNVSFSKTWIQVDRYSNFFHTLKEAVQYHNDKIEALKIK